MKPIITANVLKTHDQSMFLKILEYDVIEDI